MIGLFRCPKVSSATFRLSIQLRRVIPCLIVVPMRVTFAFALAQTVSLSPLPRVPTISAHACVGPRYDRGPLRLGAARGAH